MTDDLRPPYRIAFDNARDPYAARNALGILTTGGVPTTRTITSGAGLTGGGDLSADRTIDVGAGTGITVNANDVALTVPVSVANGGTGSSTVGAAPFVQKAGDTMTGNLTVSLANPSLSLVKAASGQAATINAYTSSSQRWKLDLGNATAESGSNLGSNFVITPYDDAGAALSFALSILRPNGQVSFRGATSNDSASAGFVGEYIESSIAAGSKVALTTGTAANVTSISLTAGDWDAWAVVQYDGGATTTVTAIHTAISTTSATLDFTQGRYAVLYGGGAAMVPYLPTVPLVPTRFSIASSTTVYLVTTAIFGTSTLGAYGRLMARRRR